MNVKQLKALIVLCVDDVEKFEPARTPRERADFFVAMLAATLASKDAVVAAKVRTVLDYPAKKST